MTNKKIINKNNLLKIRNKFNLFININNLFELIK